MAVDALAADKDVYVEKPLTHKPEEGKTILEAQSKSKRIVQVGMQQRSMPHIAKARELIQKGRIGKIYKVHLTWNRNQDRVQKKPLSIDPKTVDWKAFLGDAPDQPFDEYRFRNWRWFWDFGGGVFTDLGVHWIDVAHWLLDLDHPCRRRRSAPTRSARESGRRRTLPRRCGRTPTTCRSISRRRSPTPATAP